VSLCVYLCNKKKVRIFTTCPDFLGEFHKEAQSYIEFFSHNFGKVANHNNLVLIKQDIYDKRWFNHF